MYIFKVGKKKKQQATIIKIQPNLDFDNKVVQTKHNILPYYLAPPTFVAT